MSEIINPAKRALYQKSLETQQLIQHLESAEIGDIYTYETLSEVISQDVTDKGYGALQTARKNLLQQGIVFGTIRGTGIRRLNDEEIADSGSSYIKRSKQAATKGLKQIASCQYENLSDEKKGEYNTSVAILSLQRMAGQSKTRTAIEEKVTKESIPPNAEQLSKIFAKG